MGWKDAPIVERFDEGRFRSWYHGHAKKLGLDTNPDNPKHFYDWRAAYTAKATPDTSGHWPSEFKREGHPNLIVDGRDTRTGEPVKAAWQSAPIVEDATQRAHEAPGSMAAARGEVLGALGEGRVMDALGTMGRNAAQSIVGAGKGLVNTVGNLSNMAYPPVLSGRPAYKELQASNPAQEAGMAAERVGEFLAPGGPVKGLAGAAVQGAKAYVIDRAQGGTGTVAGALGAAGPLTAKLAEVAAPGLRKLAETQYAKALNATTRPLKAESRKVVPEMLNKREWGSLEALAETGTVGSERAGVALGKAYEGATKAGVMTDTVPILKSLDKMKQRFFVSGAGGKAINSNPGAVSKIEEVEGLIQQFGPHASPDQLWKFRKNLDDIISAGGGFGVQLTPGTTKALQREARLAIQKELNKATPDIESLNATFSLWKGLEKVAKATLERKTGQSGIVESALRSGAGGGLGLLLGDDPAWGPVGALLGLLTKSPRYRTLAAVEKARLAHALSKNQTATALSVLSRLTAGLNATSRPSADVGAESPTP